MSVELKRGNNTNGLVVVLKQDKQEKYEDAKPVWDYVNTNFHVILHTG